MNTPHRILAVLGTRPEAIKMAPIVHALRGDDRFAIRVAVTAQHRDLLDTALGFFELAPDIDLDLMAPGAALATQAGHMLAALGELLRTEAPQLVLAQGDTTTVMTTALASFYAGVPFAHVEAGLRSHDLSAPFPEELHRVIAGRTAALHFAPTSAAAQALLDEGTPADRVHVTGNTVVDALFWASGRVADDPPPTGKRRLLVTLHRREHVGETLAGICRAMTTLAARGDVELLLPVHPNPAVRATIYELLGDQDGIRLCEPLDYADLVRALRASHLVLTDSGGLQEEAPSLGKPVVVLRRETERREGIERGTAVLAGTDPASIVEITSRLLDDDVAYAAMTGHDNPYGDGRAAGRIIEACATFLDERRRLSD